MRLLSAFTLMCAAGGLVLSGCATGWGAEAGAREGDRSFRIPSSAMEPTIRCGGPGLGCTAKQDDHVAARAAPAYRRGEIVVFETPERARVDCGAGGLFVKRIIATEGETWELRDGHVYINGEKLDEPYIEGDRRDVDTRPPQRVPPDAFFVMGDNRAQSCDSRVWGPLPTKNVIGRVFAIRRGGRVIRLPG
jgi:signal peptidase I